MQAGTMRVFVVDVACVHACMVAPTNACMHAYLHVHGCADARVQVMGDIYDRLAAMHSGGGGVGPPHEVRPTSCFTQVFRIVNAYTHAHTPMHTHAHASSQLHTCTCVHA